MTKEQLCTQYELIIQLLKNGCENDVVEILEKAIKRIDSQNDE